MAEIGLIGLTALAGYFLSQKKKATETLRTSVGAFDKPNGETVYTSDMVNEANREILERSLKNYRDSENPSVTGVLPPLFNMYTNHKTNDKIFSIGTFSNSEKQSKVSDFNKQVDPTQLNINMRDVTNRPMFTNYYSKLNDSFSKDSLVSDFSKNIDTEVSLLTGKPLDRSHNNMVPFFGGNVKQNVETFSNVGLLDRHTGYSSTYIPKQETKPFFENQVENIYGSPVFTTQVDTDRYIQSNLREGEKPFQPQQVAAPIAGTIENGILLKFKNVNELRPGNRPKQSYEGRLNHGQLGNERTRTLPVNKNRPDTFYEKGSDDLFKGPGGYIAIKADETFTPPVTARADYNGEYIGPAGQSQMLNTRARVTSQSEYTVDATTTEPKKNNFNGDYSRNLNVTNMFGGDDYGKGGVRAVSTERQTYDPTEVGNAKLPEALTTRFVDNARSTMKETSTHSEHSGHVRTIFDSGKSSAHGLGISSYEVKPTMKQSLVDNNYMGGVDKGDAMGYLVTNVTAKTTDKEILTEHSADRVGNAEHVYPQPKDYTSYMDPEKVRNHVTVEYKGNSHGLNTVMSRNNYSNAECRDVKEKSFSGSRPSGPQTFKLPKSAGTLGETQLTPSMLFKEQEASRLHASTRTAQPTPSKELSGMFQAHSENRNVFSERFDPQGILSQLKDNPYVGK
ncbi:MAG: hypothetical protein EBU90_11820 [Proteobacteria bacterium]|nr:hypothetical protein [Pseudomonadota bacterium]NBP14496.1 hypothetical protein [bacterium]